MTEQKSSYRQIMKATSLFGGVQMFQILIAIIRSKFVAILLGPEGMGIAGLLRSTIKVLEQLTNMGIRISAVRNIAAANATNNQKKIATTVTILRRLVWLTGLLGMVTTFFAAPWLSDITFGNPEFTFAFRWLSISLLMTQFTNGQMVLLQGLRKLKYLAKANITGSLLGLFVTIPLYYYFGIKGIVPVILSSSAISLLLSFYFANKIKINPIKVSTKTTINEGKSMISMGVMISLSSLLTLLEAYLIRIYISNTGDLADVGFYSAGFAIIGTYVGMVFTSMGKDYYPRLAEVITDNLKMKETVNQQAEIAILILAPILNVFLIFINLVIVIMYSAKFLPISGMVHWAALGIFYKAATWSVGYIFLAKGDTKWFFWNQLFGILFLLGANILGYTYFGLVGLGISFLVAYIFAFIQNLILTNYLYEFKFTGSFYSLFVLMFGISLASFILSLKVQGFWMYLIGIFLIITTSVISYRELDKRMDITTVILSIKNKYLKKQP